MNLRRFIYLVQNNWKHNKKFKNFYKEYKKNGKKILETDFGLGLIGTFFISLVYMRWPWLHRAFYHQGELGKNLEIDDDIILSLTTFCEEDYLNKDSYIKEFLSSYRNSMIWYNAGKLAVGFDSSIEPPPEPLRDLIIGELRINVNNKPNLNTEN